MTGKSYARRPGHLGGKLANAAALAMFLTVAVALPWADARSQPAGDPCAPSYAIIRAAIAAKDRATLETEGRRLPELLDCDTDQRTRSRRDAARALAEIARRDRDRGLSAQEMETRLKTARSVFPVWEVLELLADLAFDRRAFEEADRLYQLTLNDIYTPMPGDAAVPVERQDQIYQRASEVHMIAPTEPPGTRDGSLPSLDRVLIARSRRDGRVQVRMMPVLFITAKATMSDTGRVYATRWVGNLRAAPIPALVVVGHTDPEGDPMKNEDLALRRAQALARFMRANGFSGSIIARAYGQRCPLPLSSERYTPDERNMILRRVEVMASPTLPPGHCKGQVPRGQDGPKS